MAKTVSIGILILFSCGTYLHADEKPNKELIKACFAANQQLAETFLEQGADVNAQYGEYDRQAFKRRSGGLSDMGSASWTPLMALAATESDGTPERQIILARRLLERGAKLEIRDFAGSSALEIAISYRNIELAIFLVEQGANPNAKVGTYIDNVGDETPLHLAIGHPILLQKLIAAGADLFAVDESGRNAAATAKECGYKESEQILRKAMEKAQKRKP